MITQINKTKNGQVFKCNSCNAIHIEFNNINLNFPVEQCKQFADYVSKINPSKWEEANKNSSYKRKIIIPTGHKNINFLLNREELNELNSLLNTIRIKQEQPYSRININSKLVSINFTYFFN